MNLLTGPVFTLSDGMSFRQASLEEILRGDHSGFRFSSGGTLQSLAQIWLACTLVGVLQNGESFPPDDFLEVILGRLGEDAPMYELFPGKGEPGFMQVPFEDANRAKLFEGEVETRNFLVADEESSPFSQKLVLGEHSYCYACAAKDLFLSQMIICGKGGKVGGPWGSSTWTFLDPEGDAKDQLLANILVDPSGSQKNTSRAALSLRGRKRTPTWMRPEICAELAKGSTIGLDFPDLDETVMSLWITRQVVLESRNLEKAAPCISCGENQNRSVCGIWNGASKTSAEKAGSSESNLTLWGGLRLGGKGFSPYNPWCVKSFSEEGVEKTGEYTPAIKNGRHSDLISVARDLLVHTPGNHPADVILGNSVLSETCEEPKKFSLLVFSTVIGKSFDNASKFQIPLERAWSEVGEHLGGMDDAAQSSREVLEKSLRRAVKNFLNKELPVLLSQSMGDFEKLVGGFLTFLGKDIRDWEIHLHRGVREIYRKRLLESPLMYEREFEGKLFRELAAINFPYPHKNKGAPEMTTPFTEAFKNYTSKSQNTGLRADLRRIRVTIQGVEASSTPFSSGIFSFGGSQREVMRDAQILMIHLMAEASPTSPNTGLRHKAGVSFGQALREACKSARPEETKKNIARAAMLVDAAKSSPNKFFFELDQFVGRQGGLACDLDTLYWDLYKLLAEGDKSRTTRWWVDLYRPPVQESTEEASEGEVAA